MSAYSPQIVQTLSLPTTTYGALLGAFFGFSALTATTVGRYVNGINWLAGVSLTAMFSVIGLTFLAFFANSIPLIILGLFIAAWGNSFSQTSANKGLAEHVPVGLQGRAFGFKQAALPLSTFVVGLSVPLFSTEDNWRFAFVTISIISATVGILAISQIREKTAVFKIVFARILDSGRSFKTARAKKKQRAPRHLILLATGSGLATGATMSFAGFLVLFSVGIGFSLELAALVMALGSFAGVAARVSFGFWADKTQGGHLLLVQLLMLGGAAGLVVLALTDNIALLVIGTLLVFAMGWSWNGVFQYAIIRSDPSSSAFFTGVVQAAMMAGATIGPPLFALVSQLSYSVAWIFLAITMVIAAGLVRWGKFEMERRV
jgi:predicted MFS family arabinose efflux permease